MTYSLKRHPAPGNPRNSVSTPIRWSNSENTSVVGMNTSRAFGRTARAFHACQCGRCAGLWTTQGKRPTFWSGAGWIDTKSEKFYGWSLGCLQHRRFTSAGCMAPPSRFKLSGIPSHETVEPHVCLAAQAATSPDSTCTAGTSDRSVFFGRCGYAETAQAYGTDRKGATSRLACDSLAVTREHRRGIHGHLRISKTHEPTRPVTTSIAFPNAIVAQPNNPETQSLRGLDGDASSNEPFLGTRK